MTSRSVPSLYELSKQGRWDELLSLFGRDPDLGARASRFAKPSSGWTMLHQASYFGHLDAVKRLFSLGADPRLQSRAGQTAAQVARERGHAETAEFIEKNTITSDLWAPSKDPALWPSSPFFSQARKTTCAKARKVSYGGGIVDLEPGCSFYVDDLDRVLVGWHGTYDPPCGMDGESML